MKQLKYSALLALYFFTPLTLLAQVTMGPPTMYGTIDSATNIAVGDIDGNSISDVAVISSGGNSVRVFRGQGGGVMSSTPLLYSIASTPTGIALCDLDQNGIKDLVISHDAGKGVSVLRGSGTGSSLAFAAPVFYSTGISMFAVACEDLNGDSKKDIVALSFASKLAVYLQNASGVIPSTPTLYDAPNLGNGVVLGDLDGNGSVDIATSYQGSKISLFFNQNGSGTFGPRKDITLGMVPYALKLTDLNVDGKGDILVADNRKNGVYVLLGTGAGNFATPVLYTGGTYAASLDAGEFNGDGKLDVVLQNQASGTAYFFLGNGDGTLKSSIAVVLGSGSFTKIAASDLNSDGLSDLIFSITASAIGISLNKTPVLGGFSISPSSIESGTYAFAKLLLSQPAPAGDLKVTLSSSNPSLVGVSSPTLIAEGSSSGTFPVVAGKGSGTAVITVTTNGVSQSATINVIATQCTTRPEPPLNLQ